MTIDEQVAELTVKEEAAFDRWYDAPDDSTEEHQAFAEYEQYRDQIDDLINPSSTPQEEK